MMKSTTKQSEFYRQLGESIRKSRKQLDLSQDALAKLVGLTRTSLTNIENGRQHPPLHIFCEIAQQLKVGFADLLPRPPVASNSIDVKALAGSQVRGENELAFIETGIGAKGIDVYGSAKTKDSGDSRRAS